jgi:hypothetical protein
MSRKLIPAGTMVKVSAHYSDPGKGLSYDCMTVKLIDPCETEGWDVLDVTLPDGSEGSVYSFSVEGPARRKHRVRVSYSTITEESASHGDHADHGWIDGEYENRHTLNDDDRDTTIDLARGGVYDWPSLRDAMRFVSERCSSIDTDWTPTIGTGRGFGSRWFSGTGNTSDCEDDEIGVCYDLHIEGISDGTAMRLARVMADNGVYFANVRELQRRRAR